VERILNSLIYDDKVERILAGDGSNLYRAIQPLLNPSGLIGTPCSLCLVRHYKYITPVIKFIKKK